MQSAVTHDDLSYRPAHLPGHTQYVYCIPSRPRTRLMCDEDVYSMANQFVIVHGEAHGGISSACNCASEPPESQMQMCRESAFSTSPFSTGSRCMCGSSHRRRPVLRPHPGSVVLPSLHARTGTDDLPLPLICGQGRCACQEFDRLLWLTLFWHAIITCVHVNLTWQCAQ